MTFETSLGSPINRDFISQKVHLHPELQAMQFFIVVCVCAGTKPF